MIPLFTLAPPHTAALYPSACPTLNYAPCHLLLQADPSPTSADRPRGKMMSRSLPPFHQERVVLGCGGLSADFLAEVAAFPSPDDKIRTTSLKVEGGGNAGNALTCVARLGLIPRLISKVANDTQGRKILEELEGEGVDTSYLVVSEDGNSPFTYIIVDSQTKTRTCIHTPGHPPMVPDDLSQSKLAAALNGVSIAYFDGRLPDTALKVARAATHENIPILIDAERKREGLDELLQMASYLVCSAKFPQEWTEAPSVSYALVALLFKMPKLKFAIVTLGVEGCIMIERHVDDSVSSEEIDVDDLLASMRKRMDNTTSTPTCVSSPCTKLLANGVGTITGRLLIGTAENIPPSELVDTTGAGDAFIGAILYGICMNLTPEKMVPFAAQVAAAGCRALGARSGLPHRSDPRLASFLV